MGKVRISFRFLFFAIAILIAVVIVSNFDSAHAQPLQEVHADVLEFDGTFGIVEISWNDNGASYYEAGCVSCMPNFSDAPTEDSLILNDVTSFVGGNTLLYVIAYDDADEIISGKQIMIQLP